MAIIFPKTTQYLNDFYKSKKDAYKSAKDDFRPYNKSNYGYSMIKEEHRLGLYDSVKDLHLFFGNKVSILALEVPEDFTTPSLAIQAIVDYKEYLKNDKALIEKQLEEYKDLERVPFPFEATLNYTQEVIDALTYVLSFDEIKQHQNNLNQLINIYIRVGTLKQIEYGLNEQDIKQIFEAINAGEEFTFINGRKIFVQYDTIKIYDVSKAFNKFEKGFLKDEAKKIQLISKNKNILTDLGIEITDRYEIPNPKSASLRIQNNTDPKTSLMKTSENSISEKIFISHSSKDADKIKPLIDLIENIGVKHNQIFYSSHAAYGVDLGEDIFDRLKKELNDNVLALFILSENFYASPVCLCEMGAVWIKANKQIPILIPPFNFGDVRGVFSNSLGFKINDKPHLNSFKLEIEKYFNLTPIHPSRWEEKRDEYISKTNGLIQI